MLEKGAGQPWRGRQLSAPRRIYGDRRLTGGAVFVRLGFERGRSGNSAHAEHAAY